MRKEFFDGKRVGIWIYFFLRCSLKFFVGSGGFGVREVVGEYMEGFGVDFVVKE